MRKVMAFSALCTVLGYAAVHFAFFAQSTPTPQVDEPAAQADAEPVVLANVVEVTDTDALLDARPAEAAGRPFDAEPLRGSSDLGGLRTRLGAEPIPPAEDYAADEEEVEVAPMPREASARKPLDARRVAWYGAEVIHRQVTEGMRPGNANGYGYFF